MAEEHNENIQVTEVNLRPGDTLMTGSRYDHFDFFAVKSGTVQVFVSKERNDGLSRRIFLTEADEGDFIPSFSAKGIDADGRPFQLCFLLKPTGEACLNLLMRGGTSVTVRRFVRTVDEKAAKLDGRGQNFRKSYEDEDRDFARGVLNYYEREEAKAEASQYVEQKQEVQVLADGSQLIRGAISSSEPPVVENDPLYRCLSVACRKSGIELRPLDEIRKACGEQHFSISDAATISQFSSRSVVLETDWFKKDFGVIVSDADGDPVCCYPVSYGKYRIYNGKTKETLPADAEIAGRVNPKAYVIGRTLPSSSLKKKDLLHFGIRSVRVSDLRLMLMLALAVTLIGVLIPTLNQKIYDDYIPFADEGQLIQICMVIASFMVGSLVLDMVKNLSEYRIASHIGYDLQNAVYYRVFRLPESFFRSFDSADLAQRLEYITLFAKKYTDLIMVSGVTAVFSLVYLYKMFRYSAKLSWVAILMLTVYAMLTWLLSMRIMKFQAKAEEKKGVASARLYQFLSGIEKVRMAGAEDRVANHFLQPFVEQQNTELRRDRIETMTGVLSGIVTAAFSMVFYFIIVKSKLKLSTGSFMAFNSAFGAFSGILMGLISSALDIYELRPLYDRFRPVVETACEDTGMGGIVTKLDGSVTMDNVSFSYDGSTRVLNGINLSIRTGEYVGIVGESGCGKSTLLKLLLGFETPDTGSVRYGGADLKELDRHSLRKQLGVVLQDGKLIAGSILENITITAPHATTKEVNALIEKVGLKNDIAAMPMGINTVLSENGGTISGGQQQRIMIARALIGKPSILIFDEATSALDNATQAEITRNLDEMRITRIVVAHRLSTIRNCDRILVLDHGKVAESGTHDELMAHRGLYYQLASRQLG